MSARKNNASELRIGADFGPGHTGIALLDGDNRVLAREVIVHRVGLSDTLKIRRENRAMRRRAKSKSRRLRDFRALLAEMKIAPQFRIPDSGKEKQDALEKRVNAVGNRLYALAHRRGWDYAELTDLLVVRPEGKPPKKAALVDEIDKFLKGRVPPELLTLDPPNPPERKKSRTQSDHDRRVRQWQSAREALECGKNPPEESRQFIRLPATCLGELAEAESQAYKNPDDPELQARAENIRQQLQGGRENISRWLKERLCVAFGGGAPDDPAVRNALDAMLVRLGLADGKDAFERGEIYSPDRNRHRSEMLRELDELLNEAEGENAVGASAEQWLRWKKRARAVLQREYRQKRFLNRSPGKCPARILKDGEWTRCNRNLPQRGKVRELLFEIEARQMRVVDAKGDGEIRNLRDDELAELKECVNFRKGKIRDIGKWKEFLSRRFPPPKKNAEDEGDDEAQTKRDQLRAIAQGSGVGRVRGLCRQCMEEKIRILKAPNDSEADDQERRERWNALHGETIFGLGDAPPALRQKVEIVCRRVIRMLKNAGFQNPKDAPVFHIGVEQAAFDISAMSSAKGERPKKKSAYQKRRPREIPELVQEQEELCIYCDSELGSDRTVDHLGARRRGGGDSALNRVVMCGRCNILKGKKAINQLAENAMAALRQNNPEKAEFLKNNMGRIVANLSPPQQTMFGAKVLRGALAEAILDDPARAKEFPIIRARDTSLLRQRWFPKIHRMKRALRADESGGYFPVEAGYDRQWPEKNIAPPDMDDPNVPRFVRQCENRQFALSPDEGDEGVWHIPLTDGGEFRVAVRSPKDSPVREYHHAVDAIVAAAKVDWDKIARLERDASDRNSRARITFWRQAESGRPGGELAEDDIPDDWHGWRFNDKKDKSGPKRSRTNRQPLRKIRLSRTDKREFLVHRKPLHELTCDEVKRIPDSAVNIRNALKNAWENIGKKTDAEERKRITTDNGAKIAPAYFLALLETDILHPKNTRSVSIRPGGKEGQRAETAFPIRSHRTPDGIAHTHRFLPETPAWAEVAVWSEKDKKGKVKIVSSRRRENFYIRPKSKRQSDDLLEWENGPPPPNARILRRGHEVRLKGKEGMWRINALDEKNAMVEPADDGARMFNQTEPAVVEVKNLFWTGQSVTRTDIPGIWKVDKLRGCAILTPADQAARDAAENGAPDFVEYKKLQHTDNASPSCGETARRMGKYKGKAMQLWPGIWKITGEKSGKIRVLPDDNSARRAAKNSEKKAQYSALISE